MTVPALRPLRRRGLARPGPHPARPTLAHALRPPPGSVRRAFYYVDDFYNYLSYAQQAEGGSFLFANKVLLDDHRPALVNLEWSLVGRPRAGSWAGPPDPGLPRLRPPGRRLASSGSTSGCARLGLPASHRLPALLLLTTGGRLGGASLFGLGARDHALPRPLRRALPVPGLLSLTSWRARPAFLGLLLFDTRAASRARSVAALLALRPRPRAPLRLRPPRRSSAGPRPPPRSPPGVARRARCRLPASLPAVAYLYWLFYLNPAFSFYAAAPLRLPSPSRTSPGRSAPRPPRPPGAASSWPGRSRPKRPPHLAFWAGLGVVVIVLQPVHFSLQFLVGIGFRCWPWGPVGLARWQPHGDPLVALAFSTTQQVAPLDGPPAQPLLAGAPVRTWRRSRPCGRCAARATSCSLPRAWASTPTASRPAGPSCLIPWLPTTPARMAILERFSRMRPLERRAVLDTYRVRISCCRATRPRGELARRL